MTVLKFNSILIMNEGRVFHNLYHKNIKLITECIMIENTYEMITLPYLTLIAILPYLICAKKNWFSRKNQKT